LDSDAAGRLISGVLYDYAVSLELSDRAVIRLETTFELAEAGGATVVIDPEAADQHHEALNRLADCIISEAVVDEDAGQLALTFDNGMRLRAMADPHFEAWTVATPTELIVALPGGGVGIWGPRQEHA
jgi:hypothetical protein